MRVINLQLWTGGFQMNKRISIFALMVWVGMNVVSYADTFSYTDSEGTMHFVDDVASVPNKYRKQMKHDKDERETAKASSRVDSSQSSSSSGDLVQICYNSGIPRINGRDLTDFLAARGYDYRTRNTSDKPGNARLCAELWCNGSTQAANNFDSNKCIAENTEKFIKNDSSAMPFNAIGDKVFRNASMNMRNIIDKHFNVDPNTPIKWQ